MTDEEAMQDEGLLDSVTASSPCVASQAMF